MQTPLRGRSDRALSISAISDNKRESWRCPCGQSGQDQDSAGALVSSDRIEAVALPSPPSPFHLFCSFFFNHHRNTSQQCELSATASLQHPSSCHPFSLLPLLVQSSSLNSILRRSFPSSSFGCCSYFGNNNKYNNNNSNTNIQST